MRIYQLLMLLLLAVIALSSVVQACGDCHDEEKKKVVAKIWNATLHS